MNDKSQELLTRKEAQTLLRIGTNKMLSLIRNKSIPASKIGNTYRIRKKDLLKYIENNMNTTLL